MANNLNERLLQSIELDKQSQSAINSQHGSQKNYNSTDITDFKQFDDDDHNDNYPDLADDTQSSLHVTPNNLSINSNNSSKKKKKKSAAISMAVRGAQPTNTNIIEVLRRKASQTGAARIDNVFLYSSIPTIGDAFNDHKTSVITLIHFGFLILIIILLFIGIFINDIAFIYATSIGIITNIFGVIHSMYSGNISSKLSKLDVALQNFANVIHKFAKALNIQEAYLISVKNFLNFIDHHTLLIDYYHSNPDAVNTAAVAKDVDQDKDVLKSYSNFIKLLKKQTIIQHKKWILTLFGQYQLLDNRFGITKQEYIDFVNKLPNKSRCFFQSLTGIHTRFKQLNVSDELNQPPPNPIATDDIIEESSPELDPNDSDEDEKEEIFIIKKKKESIGIEMESSSFSSSLPHHNNSVLLYRDMEDLVHRVLKDIGTDNPAIQNALSDKMIYAQKEKHRKQKIKQKQKEFILSKRMSVSLARDVPNVKYNKLNLKKRKQYKSHSHRRVFSANNKYHKLNKMKTVNNIQLLDSDSDDDGDVYDLAKNRSNTLPNTSSSNLKKNVKRHLFNTKIKSYEEYSPNRSSRRSSVDEKWLKMVMNGLHVDDDDEKYHYK